MSNGTELPAKLRIYSGPNESSLISATLFTRLTTSADSSDQLNAALAGTEAFTFVHNTSILIFDSQQDPHHDHFRDICLRLKNNGDIGVQYGQCVFDATTATTAGFQIEKLDAGGLMIVDLHDNDDEDSSDDDENEESAPTSGTA